MKVYDMLFTSDELPVLRDAVTDALLALRAHAKTVSSPSENLTKRLVMLQGLKETLADKCLKTR